MDELLRRVAGARHLVDPQWTPTDVQQLAGAVERRQRAVRRRQVTAVAALAAAAVALVVWQGRPSRQAVTPSTEVATWLHPLRWGDGSAATPLDDVSAVQALASTSERVVVRVVRGRARFDVARRPARVFRVEAGGVAVEVLGTSFSVERRGEGARVVVAEGAVRVRWRGRHRDLRAGQAEAFDPGASDEAPEAPVEAPHPEADVAAPDAPPDAGVDASPPPSVAPRTARAAWRELAARGEYDGAWRALADAGTATVADTTEDLLRAADVARRSGHPAEALPHLRAVVDGHPDDPGAAAAGFTLGRVLLEDLRRPAEAATAFARARALAGGGPLAESALAREVECRAQSGETARARDLAETYLRLHPTGRYARAVRQNGGLE